jgi:hypothetical protein
MEKLGIEIDIKNYCDRQDFKETCATLQNYNGKARGKFEDIFEAFFSKNNDLGNKLSFAFTVNNKQKLLKERLAEMNVKNISSSKKYVVSNEIRMKKNVVMNKSKNKQKKTVDNEMPESFLLLMDELCIDRKDARKFFENPDQWAFIKSNRKIFCTKRGNYFTYICIKINNRMLNFARILKIFLNLQNLKMNEFVRKNNSE